MESKKLYKNTFYDVIADNYDYDYKGYMHNIRRISTDLLKKHRYKFNHFFDPLCGSGKAVSFCNSVLNIEKITVNDFSKEMLNVAKRNCPNANIVCSDINSAVEETFKNKFDGMQISIPGSFVDLDKLFKNSYSWLKDDGVLIYITSRSDTFSELYTGDFSRNSWIFNSKKATNHLPKDEKSINNKMEKIGFQLLDQKLIEFECTAETPEEMKQFAIYSSWAEPFFSNKTKLMIYVTSFVFWLTKHFKFIAPKKATARVIVSIYKK